MFSLKEHTRRNVKIAALGAAASIGFGALQASAATVSWDPGLTPATPSGGSSTGPGNQLNNTDTNWSTGAVDRALLSTDDAHFGTVGGNVTNTGAPTSMKTLTLDVGGYNISGGSILVSPTAGTTTTVLTNVTGTNTISSPITTTNPGNGATVEVNVTGVLNTGDFSMGGYGLLRKTGNGVWNLSGKLDNTGTVRDTLEVAAGTVILSGNANRFGASLSNANGTAGSVASGATLAGNASVLHDSNTAFTINGTIAPGANPIGSNFGGVGTFAINGNPGNPVFGGTGPITTFAAGSHLALDLVTPDLNPDLSPNAGVHDRYNMTSGNYGGSLIIVGGAGGAVVDINNGTGSLVEGTYHIVNLFNSNPAGQNRPVTFTDGGFAIGTAPTGYAYQINHLANGVDLVVTATGVPEPASVALLGIGSGLLMLRRRRHD